MWSENDIGNLKDKVIIVTGGNSGLGYEDVKVFYKYGAMVILACRNMEKGLAAKRRIKEELENVDMEKGSIDVMELDLASLNSIRQFAARFKAKYNRLDILLNNAGIMITPYGLTEDGFEQQIGVNHLGHFALTGLLFDLLKSTPDARVVTISSNAHKAGSMPFKNFMFDDGEGYKPFKSYARSKLCNLLFAYELQRRINQTVYDIRSLGAHPGGAKTDLGRHVEDRKSTKIIMNVMGKVIQSAYDGALPGIRAALDVKALGGEYYGPSGFMETKGKPVLVDSNHLSHNKILAKRLWRESERLTGITFDFS